MTKRTGSGIPTQTCARISMLMKFRRIKALMQLLGAITNDIVTQTVTTILHTSVVKLGTLLLLTCVCLSYRNCEPFVLLILRTLGVIDCASKPRYHP